MVNDMKYIKMLSAIVMLSLFSQSTYAAIALDRTRVLYNEGERSVSMVLENENKSIPYLAQSWLENSQDEKINSPFVVTPPVQRIEAGNKSQI
ncbi:fimbria/pilus periplasmic chaperone, partial [Escherichia coli]|nr:fimbria/pilus periplasmic chaperone [Escherichia coli]